jgi:two-component system, sensor histidine kinase and response regulator
MADVTHEHGRYISKSAVTARVRNGESMSPEPVLDSDGALARLGGDKELFADMIGYMLEDVPPLFSELSAAISGKDAPTIRMKAHALKGLVASCGGVRASHVAQRLENAGQSGDVSNADTLLDTLEKELATLTSELTAYRQQMAAPGNQSR